MRGRMLFTETGQTLNKASAPFIIAEFLLLVDDWGRRACQQVPARGEAFVMKDGRSRALRIRGIYAPQTVWVVGIAFTITPRRGGQGRDLHPNLPAAWTWDARTARARFLEGLVGQGRVRPVSRHRFSPPRGKRSSSRLPPCGVSGATREFNALGSIRKTLEGLGQKSLKSFVHSEPGIALMELGNPGDRSGSTIPSPIRLAPGDFAYMIGGSTAVGDLVVTFVDVHHRSGAWSARLLST